MDFLRELFSETPGVSYGRVGSAVLLMAGVLWVSFLVWTTKQLPDLSGLALLIGTPFGLSKGLNILKTNGAEKP